MMLLPLFQTKLSDATAEFFYWDKLQIIEDVLSKDK